MASGFGCPGLGVNYKAKAIYKVSLVSWRWLKLMRLVFVAWQVHYYSILWIIENLKRLSFLRETFVALLILALDVLVLAMHHLWSWPWQGGLHLGLRSFGLDTADLVNIPHEHVFVIKYSAAQCSAVFIAQRSEWIADVRCMTEQHSLSSTVMSQCLTGGRGCRYRHKPDTFWALYRGELVERPLAMMAPVMG